MGVFSLKSSFGLTFGFRSSSRSKKPAIICCISFLVNLEQIQMTNWAILDIEACLSQDGPQTTFNPISVGEVSPSSIRV
jgi:hypothetical protein